MQIQHIKRLRFWIVGIIWSFLSVTSVQAQFAEDAIRILQDENGISARAFGMGNAFVGLADDYSALYWNPAGLAYLDDAHFYGEISNLNYQNDVSFFGTKTEDDQNYTKLSSIGFALPLPTSRGSFVIGLGYNRVKNFDQNIAYSGLKTRDDGFSIFLDDIEFEFDQDLQQSFNISDEGSLDQWNVGFGIALSPRLMAGVTAVIYSGNSNFNANTIRDDINNVYENRIIFTDTSGVSDTTDFARYELNQFLETDYQALSLKFGAMVELAPGLKLGGVIGLPTTFSVEEVFTESDNILYDDGIEDPLTGDPAVFEYDVETPFYFDAGFSYKVPMFTLAGSMRYRDWSQTRFDIPSEFEGDSLFQDLESENTIIRTDYRATTEYNIGGEVRLPALNARLRGGYSVVPDPRDNVPDEFDKTYISFGVGLKLDRRVHLDIGYRQGSWENFPIDSNGNFITGGPLEEITTRDLRFGLTYRF